MQTPPFKSKHLMKYTLDLHLLTPCHLRATFSGFIVITGCVSFLVTFGYTH